MRTIDADLMKENIVDNGAHDVAAELRKWVDSQPTVDAIPVEWLEKQAALSRAIWDYDTCEAIRIVLKEWQKEQEET